LPVHPEPEHRNNQPSYTGGNILRDLPALLPTEFLDAVIVALYLGEDRRTVHHLILRLNSCYGLRRSARARANGGGDASRQ
jgi:hypothetical protein